MSRGNERDQAVSFYWSSLLILPSVFVVYRFLSPQALLVYVPGVFLLVRCGAWSSMDWLRRLLPERSAHRVLMLLLVGLAFSAMIAYPFLNAGWGTTRGGTDRDDALIILVRECLAGHYPYYSTTPGGNPLTPMPGAGLLAAPFVITGQIALQNLFWLGVVGLWLR